MFFCYIFMFEYLIILHQQMEWIPTFGRTSAWGLCSFLVYTTFSLWEIIWGQLSFLTLGVHLLFFLLSKKSSLFLGFYHPLFDTEMSDIVAVLFLIGEFCTCIGRRDLCLWGPSSLEGFRFSMQFFLMMFGEFLSLY